MRLALFQKDCNTADHQRVLWTETVMPADYMGDYSRLALMVGSLDDALRVLAENRFTLTERFPTAGVELDAAAQIPLICELLAARGIQCTLADAVAHVYQG